ncbi:MFS transporter, partial [Streptomyces sp. WAC06614]|uniref:MFS transporter n=1 Tax=Streptomyces sp. WAC06614 TaxID=2487416 RepID=UPI000FB28F9C
MSPAHTGAPTTMGASPSPSPAAAAAPTAAPAPAPAPERLAPGLPGYRRMTLALFAAGLATFALLYSTQALLPALSEDLGVSAGRASWTVSAATGALALCVLPLSALSERFGRVRMMTVSLLLAVAVGLLVPLAPSIEWLVALRAVQGAAIAGIPASAMAYLAEEVRPKALVAAIGLFVAGNSLGGMSGRLVTGWAAQLGG